MYFCNLFFIVLFLLYNCYAVVYGILLSHFISPSLENKQLVLLVVSLELLKVSLEHVKYSTCL